MFEIALIVVVCSIMYKIAEIDPQASPLIWTVVKFVTRMACLAIPLPFLRVFIGLLASIGALVAFKAISR
jgi:hypothetical protein